MALRDINLVPPEILSRHDMVQCLLRHALILAVCLTVIFGIHGYQTRFVLAKMRPATTLSDMHTHLGATLNEITDTQKEIERLSLQQSILQQLTVHHPFSALLQMLAVTMHPQVWLAQLEINAGQDKDAHHRLRLQGYALSNESLADFLTALSAAALVDGVVLKLAKNASVAGLTANPDQLIPAVSFEIACRLREPGS